MSLRRPPHSIVAFISTNSCSKRAPSFSTLPSIARLSTRARSHLRFSHASIPASRKRSFHASASSAAPKDPYQILGVKKDASPAEIKKVYFSLARKYHPDTNPDKGARDKFVEIQEAYDTLKDNKKRKAYDQYGAASQQPGFDPDVWGQSPFGSAGAGGFGGFEGFSQAFGGRTGGAPGDLFEQLFGAFGGRPSGFSQNLRGEDLEATIGISFMESCKGTTRTLNITPVEDCATCTGTGLKPGVKRSTCATCGGSGTRTFVIESGFQMASTCSTCQGTGTTIPRSGQCSSCRGIGKVRTRKTVEVDVPAGVEDGTTLRVKNAGDGPVSGNGPAGDLLVRINVAASKTFRRKGINIYHDLRIPMHTALLGGRVRVPTLDGEVEVRVPGGTQQGEEMVLKDRGVVQLIGKDKGDLFVTFTVQLPRSLTRRQREILQQYADDVEGRTNTTKPEPQQDETKLSHSSSELRKPKPEDDNHNDALSQAKDTPADEPPEDLEQQKRATA